MSGIKHIPTLPALLILLSLITLSNLFPQNASPPSDKTSRNDPETEIREREARLKNLSGADKVLLMLEISDLYAYNNINPKKRLDWLNQAHAFNSSLPRPVPKSKILIRQARYRHSLNQSDAAMEILRSIMDDALKSGNHPDYCESSNLIGKIYFDLGQYREAISFYKQALEVAFKYELTHIIIDSLTYTGLSYHYLGDSQTGLNSMQQALKIAENKKALALDSGDLYSSLGIIYMSLKNDSLALDSYQKGLRFFIECGSISGAATGYNNIGLIYLRQKNFAKAREYYQLALEEYQRSKKKTSVGIVLGNLGEVAENENKLPEALKYYNQAYNLAVETGDGYGVAYLLKYISGVTRKMGRLRDALRFAQESLASSRKIDVKELESAACLELTDCYSALGDYKNALFHHRQYQKIESERFTVNISKQMAELHNRYEIETKENEIKLLKKKEQLQEQQLERKNLLLKLYLAIATLMLLVLFILVWRYYQKKKSREAIRQSEEKFQRLVEWAGDGIVILRDDKIRYANPAFCRMLGYQSGDLLGKSFSRLIVPGLQNEGPVGGKPRLHSAAALYDTVMERSDHSSVNTEIQADTFFSENSKVDLYIVRDISLRKQAEAERIQRSKLEAIGILAGGIAHDFNNLLSVILGNIDMARRFAEDNPTIVTTLGKAEKASLKARELALRFLTFSEGGEPLRRPIPVKTILNEASEMLKADMNITFKMDLQPGLLRIDGDPDQIHQAFVDLMMNAAEAMHRTGVITITAENTEIIASGGIPLEPGHYVRIQIKDTGEGIPPEDLPKIFDLYFSTRQRVSQKGLGFGLPIVYSIIKRHKGHIDIASEPGKGVVATLYLPGV